VIIFQIGQSKYPILYLNRENPLCLSWNQSWNVFNNKIYKRTTCYWWIL